MQFTLNQKICTAVKFNLLLCCIQTNSYAGIKNNKNLGLLEKYTHIYKRKETTVDLRLNLKEDYWIYVILPYH